MTDIYVDRDGMEIRLREVIARIDESDATLSDLPSAPDAGIATSIIALIAVSYTHLTLPTIYSV